MGAPPSANEAARTHWSFQPLKNETPAAVKDEAWVRTPVDRYILAEMEKRGVAPAQAATKEQFIRRVTFDLIGLPPTTEETDAFVADESPHSAEKLVERLLASPRYGERWARHWLDIVRFAESDGFEHDALRPHAWRYRDYVIRAFNDDKPYDQFVTEQIAGDELWPDKPEAQIATAFHLLGPDMVDSADQVQRRLNTLNDATDVTAAAFLGLTLGCARCHDHKLEPFTQEDYFSMQAFFAPAEFVRDLPVPATEEKAAHEKAMAAWREKTGPAQEQIDLLEKPHRERLLNQKLARLSEEVQAAHRTPPDQRTDQQEATVQETADMVKVTDAEVAKLLTADEKKSRQTLLDEIKRIRKPPALPMTLAMRNRRGTPEAVHVLVRGDYNSPGETVHPAFPAVMKASTSAQNQSAAESVKDTAARRAALAKWIASPDNTLTARIMVNRIWQHHFGRGIAATPGDFGMRGTAPSNPALLDWLAREFIAQGWSIKAMHRLMVLSATYAQSAEASPETLARDPDNSLFSRRERIRLEGEAIRDSLLAVSGRLNLKMYGPGVQPPIPEEITKTSKNWAASADKSEHTRRSIYILVRRNLRFPFLEVFDAPDSNQPCAERGRSTTAPQALSLLNSDEVTDAARGMARLITESQGDDDSACIVRAFRIALGRKPAEAELIGAAAFLAETRDRFSAEGNSDARAAALTEFCRALLNLNAFSYVD